MPEDYNPFASWELEDIQRTLRLKTMQHKQKVSEAARLFKDIIDMGEELMRRLEKNQ